MAKITSVKDLIKALEAQGFTCTKGEGRKNHWKIYQGQRLLTTTSCTPSDYRAIRNCVTIMRRHGFCDR